MTLAVAVADDPVLRAASSAKAGPAMAPRNNPAAPSATAIRMGFIIGSFDQAPDDWPPVAFSR
jgi:hypothetical protein